MKGIKRFVATLCSLVLVALTASSGITASASTAAYTASDSMYLTVNQASKIKIIDMTKNAKYTYKSSNTKVATVSNKGVVKGIALGTASIKVKEIYKKKTNEVGVVAVTVRPTLDRAKTIERSLVSTGNNFRIKNAIEKAQKGDPVTIAYVGGSITEGTGATTPQKCYAYRSYEYFKKTFGKGDGSNVKFLNAGMAGTPSTLGMLRYDRDVIQKGGAKPDIVFVEFAVNDNDDPTKGDCYESLVRNILKSDNKPAVVLLFSIFKNRWNLQDRLSPVGTYYNLPMVSVYDGILPDLKSGAISDDEYFSDQYHPNDFGHQLYADCISHYFDVVNKETKAENDITIPDTGKIGNSFDGVQMITSKSKSDDYTVTPGSFTDTDTAIGSFIYDSTSKTFPDNWKRPATATANDPLKVTVTCKNFVVVAKSSGNATGKVDVYVDGVKKTTIDGTQGGAWNNPYSYVIFNDAASAKHTIEIKAADDSLTKNFTVMAMGYAK